jgi:hypothetical protein
MRNFLYRLPRFKADLPMDFILGEAVVIGTCVNISESGLRGTFSNPVPAGAEGQLTLYHGEQSFQTDARVESFRAGEARVRFCLTSDQELEDLRGFLKLLTPIPLWRR